MIIMRRELSTSLSCSFLTSFPTGIVVLGALDVNEELSSEVTSGRREVSDSAVRVDPLVEATVVRKIVVSSGRELGVVQGHVVVTVVRAAVVLV